MRLRLALAAGGLIGVAALSGCAAPTTTELAASTVGNTSTVAGSPDDAAVGAAYPYDLYAHCGIRWAEFDGRTWLAVAPTWGRGDEGYLHGTMTLVSENLAQFVWPGGQADFAPSQQTPELCS